MRKVLNSILIGFIALSLSVSFLTPSLVFASHENKAASQSKQGQEDKGILRSVGEFLNGAGKTVAQWGGT